MSKTYGFLSDNYLFHKVYLLEETTLSNQFENFNNAYESYIINDESNSATTGWYLDGVDFVNTNNLEPTIFESGTMRVLFVSSESKMVFLSIQLGSNSSLATTFTAAAEAGIQVIDISNHENAEIGAQLIDNVFVV